MSRLPRPCFFSIDVGENGRFYVCIGSTRISSPFMDKAICREFCSAIERSFDRLQTRYLLQDYRASLNFVETASSVGGA